MAAAPSAPPSGPTAGFDLGPLVSGEFEPSPPEGSPISRALRRIGARVVDAHHHDEFEAVGLTAHRRTDGWAAPDGA